MNGRVVAGKWKIVVVVVVLIMMVVMREEAKVAVAELVVLAAVE